MPSSSKWVVTTSGDRPIEDVKEELARMGLAVGEVLEAAGCITGTASDETADRIRSVAGVADVSPAPPSIDIGPPDAEETW